MRQEWIEDLLAVLDTGSITAAAERRCLTQSAFTRRLRTVESALGGELLDRRRKPARLLPHVAEREAEMRALLVRLNALRNALADPAGRVAQRVSIACQHTIATTISPGLIRELTRERTLNVRVRESDRAGCLMLLLSAAVDFAVVFETPEEALGEGRRVLLEERIGRDRMIPVIAASYRERFESAMAERALSLIAYPPDVHFGQLFETGFLAALAPDIAIERTAETGLALAALHYTLQGIGIGWLPRSVAAEEIDRGTLLDVSARLPGQDLEVKIVRLERTMSALAEEVWKRIATDCGRGDARLPAEAQG